MEIKQYYMLFAKQLKALFNKNISVGVEFDECEHMYKLWHNYENFEDTEFKKVIGKCIKEIFYANKIFDYYITYENRSEFSVDKASEAFIYEYEAASMKFTNYKPVYYNINTNTKINDSILDGLHSCSHKIIKPKKYIAESNIYWEEDPAA